MARGNSPSSTAPPSIGHGPQSQRSPSAWKTKAGSGPTGEGGGSDSRELGDARTQPPPPSPPRPRERRSPEAAPRKVSPRRRQRVPGGCTRPGTVGDWTARWGRGEARGRSRRPKKGLAAGRGGACAEGAGLLGGAEPAGPGLPETVTALTTTAAAAAAVGHWGLGGAQPRLLGQLELAVAGGQEEDLEPGACSGPGGGSGCSWSLGSAGGGGGFSAKQVSEAESPRRRRRRWRRPGPR